MTALAMVLGMLPMAIGLGEGGEQNAPLGRAVIGGLLMATAVTLLIVPAAYAALRRKPPTKHLLEERFLAEAAGGTLDEDAADLPAAASVSHASGHSIGTTARPDHGPVHIAPARA
jgi:hypothetical protein